MLYPASYLMTGTLTSYTPDGRTQLPSRSYGPAVAFARADIPSFFVEQPFNKGNNVCHVKATSIGLRDSSNLIVLPSGVYRRNSWNSSPSAPQMFLTRFEYSDHCFRQWDCTLQRMSSTRTILKFVYAYWGCDPNGKSTDRNVYLGYRGELAAEYWYDEGRVLKRSSSRIQFTADELAKVEELCSIALPKRYYDDRPSYDQTYDELMFLSDMISYSVPYKRNYRGSPKNVFVSTSPDPGVLRTSLLFSEHDLLFGNSLGEPYAAYHIKAARQASYLDALDHIPQLNENSLSNVVELVAFIKALVIDHRVEIPHSLQSAWLQYRYSYTTSKLDMEEAISFVNRHIDKEFLQKGFSCYGSYNFDYKGRKVVMKCRLTAKQKELSYLEEIWTALYRYGLSPSFYVVWDMIPYSFIVDWFIPIGDMLSGYDKTTMYDRTYDITNLWYSLSYDSEDVLGTPTHAYTRWGEDSSPGFEGYYTLENKGTTSNKVIGYRIIDALSLIFK